MRIDTYEEASALLRKYPFFTYAALRAAELTDDPAEREHLKTIVALQLSATGAPYTAGAPADAPEATPDAIDAFLAGYSTDTPMPYTPGSDLTPDSAIADEQPPTPPPTEAGEGELELTDEEIARNLIKNRKYEEALAIIERLNLINPKKSIYFADQIRFLKKLILNQAKS